MNRSLSIYFEFARFVGSLMVFFVHSNQEKFFGQGWFDGLGTHGHNAVMMFFVMSGFVISYVTDDREKTLSSFWLSRFARFWSVIIPALLLTIFVDAIGQQIDPSLYTRDYVADQPILRFFVTIFFVNELWFSSWHPFSNPPFWSIGYEFWYYVVFAAWYFFSGWRRVVTTGAAVLIAGPKILLLFPLWLMGAAVYYVTVRVVMPKWLSVGISVLSVLLYLLYYYADAEVFLAQWSIAVLGQETMSRLGYSIWFVHNNIVGLIIALNFLGMSQAIRDINIPEVVEKVIRYLAGMTFALYVMHFPLLMFYSTFLSDGLAILLAVFFTVLSLKSVTEDKKREWKRWIGIAAVQLRIMQPPAKQ